MAREYRQLSSDEIDKLVHQQCTCANWSQVRVAEGFSVDRVHRTCFSGQIKLGISQGTVSFFGGVEKPTGISNARLHNCTIGDNVYIDQVRNCIANYVIEDDVVIENVDLLAVDGESSFGNGVEAEVVNEGGGREIPIFDKLTSQTAYLMAFYRHRPKVVDALTNMARAYTESVTGSVGAVGCRTRLVNCRIIKNVRIGPAAVVEGVNRLENGSINSCPEDPVYIGPGVIAEDFIAASGSRITDGTLVSKCFVGQGTELAKQYSAENSVFFANCGGFHGEACAIFAGPYTVTHHKSTLLIAGLFSFLNAGSGTNQSNHMYKLGPVHQGVVERGSKTASDSYMLWPAKVGAFTVVMGRHYRNSDTSDLPFSYLIEHEDESILAPGVNLRSAGTVRDARKWPRRDKRKDPHKLDLINFKLLSPFTVRKMLNGTRLLRGLLQAAGEHTEYYTYNNVRIKNNSLHRGIRLYDIGTTKFLGNCLIARLEAKDLPDLDALRHVLEPQTTVGTGKWLDLVGLLAPQECVEDLLERIENGDIATLDELSDAFAAVHADYPMYEWAWAARVLEEKMGKPVSQMTVEEIVKLISDWKHAVVELDNMLYADAKKEFAATAQIGYGTDGDEETKVDDFAAVRGTLVDNSFVSEIMEHIERKTRLGDDVIAAVKRIAVQSEAKGDR